MRLEDIKKIKEDFDLEIKKVKNSADIFSLKVKYLGRKAGILTEILKSLKDLAVEERRIIGSEANVLKTRIESILEEKLKEFRKNEFKKKSFIDVSRPGQKIEKGHLHPITKVYFEIEKIFSSMGFEIAQGPEIETERYNFDALNIPINHPARDMWDTIWLMPENQKLKVENQKLLLRTHTSPVQIRYAETHRLPIKIISPGKVYRYEATDASHDFEFHQLEGLMIDEMVSVANFKYIVEEFLKRFFSTHGKFLSEKYSTNSEKNNIEIRLRPSYFPFVEPGFEVDIKLNQKLRVKNQSSEWLEIMGAGMVHPIVLKNMGINPDKYQGFAFGMGIDRLAMLKYKIYDIRLFRSGDFRFIEQF